MSLLVNFARINTKSSQSGYSYNHYNNKSIQLIFYKKKTNYSQILERDLPTKHCNRNFIVGIHFHIKFWKLLFSLCSVVIYAKNHITWRVEESLEGDFAEFALTSILELGSSYYLSKYLSNLF